MPCVALPHFAAAVVVLLVAAVGGVAAAPNQASDTTFARTAAQPLRWSNTVTAGLGFSTAVLVPSGNATVAALHLTNTFYVYDTVTGEERAAVNAPNCSTIQFIAPVSTTGVFFVGCSDVLLTYNSLTIAANSNPAAVVLAANDGDRTKFQTFVPVGRVGSTDLIWIDRFTDDGTIYNGSTVVDMSNLKQVWINFFVTKNVGTSLSIVNCPTPSWCALYVSDNVRAKIFVINPLLGTARDQYAVALGQRPQLMASATDSGCITGCLITFWNLVHKPIVLRVVQFDAVWSLTQLSLLNIPLGTADFVIALRPARAGAVAPWFVAVAYTGFNVTLFDELGQNLTTIHSAYFRGVNLVDATPAAAHPNWVFVLLHHDVNQHQQTQTGLGMSFSNSTGDWVLNSASPLWTTTLDNAYTPMDGLFPAQTSPDGTRTLVAFPGTLIDGNVYMHHVVALLDAGTGNIYRNLILAEPSVNDVRTAFPPLYDATSKSYVMWASAPTTIASFDASSTFSGIAAPGDANGAIVGLSWNKRITAVMSDGTVSFASITPGSGALVISGSIATLPANITTVSTTSFNFPDGSAGTYFVFYNSTHGCIGAVDDTPKLVGMYCDAAVIFLRATLSPSRAHLVAYGDAGAVVLLTESGLSRQLYYYTGQGTVNFAAVDDDRLYVATNTMVVAMDITSKVTTWVVNYGSDTLIWGLTIGFTRTIAFCALQSGFFVVDRVTGNKLQSFEAPNGTVCEGSIATWRNTYFTVYKRANGTKYVQGHSDNLKATVAFPQIEIPDYVTATGFRAGAFVVTSDGVGLYQATAIVAFDLIRGKFLWATRQKSIVNQMFVSAVDTQDKVVYSWENIIGRYGQYSAINAYVTFTGSMVLQLQVANIGNVAPISYAAAPTPCTVIATDDGADNGIILYKCLSIAPAVLTTPASWNSNAPFVTDAPQPAAPVDSPSDGKDAKAVIAVVIVVMVLGVAGVTGFLYYNKRKAGMGGLGFARNLGAGYSTVDSASDAFNMQSIRSSSVA